MIDILSWKPKCIENTFQAITSKVEENLRTFQGLPLKLKDFSRLCEPYSTEVTYEYVGLTKPHIFVFTLSQFLGPDFLGA